MKTPFVSLWAVLVSLAFLLVACQPSQNEQSKRDGSQMEIRKESPISPTTTKEIRSVEQVRVVIDGPPDVGDGEDKGVTTSYQTRQLDPALEDIKKKNEQISDAKELETSEIRSRQKEEKERLRKEKLRLSSELPPDARPTSIDEFEVIPHLPPAPQYMTGTCWSFAATSLIESEVLRTSNQKIKLSEMHTVYHEYLAKGERFVKERSKSHFEEGSEANAIVRILTSRGAVPEEVYPGIVGEDDRHNHVHMVSELIDLLEHFNSEDHWDVSTTRGMFEVILNKYLGDPPLRFSYDDVDYNPVSFSKDKLKIEPTDYVDFMSTLKIPFHTKGKFDVPDNWWYCEDYHNLPLNEFFDGIKAALKGGFSVVVSIDVSEPGKNSETDTMFIPSYDIPAANIDQLAREHRMSNKSTTDDHAIHLVGYARIGDRDWFLAKDSGRGARHGKVEGYYFIRDDYVRLKVLAFTVHKDAVKDILSKF